jgi:hypothetical protein
MLIDFCSLILAWVAVSGSEWYSDGVRWRAVGGQVTVIKLGAQTAINGATATGETTLLIDSPATTCKIPAGLFQIGDRILIETYISKPNTASPVASNMVRYRLGTSASGADTIVSAIGGVPAANRVSNERRFLESISNTTLRKWLDNTNNIDFPTTIPSPLNTTDQYLTVTSGLAAGTASDTLQLLSYTVTLRTCG